MFDSRLNEPFRLKLAGKTAHKDNRNQDAARFYEAMYVALQPVPVSIYKQYAGAFFQNYLNLREFYKDAPYCIEYALYDVAVRFFMSYKGAAPLSFADVEALFKKVDSRVSESLYREKLILEQFIAFMTFSLSAIEIAKDISRFPDTSLRDFLCDKANQVKFTALIQLLFKKLDTVHQELEQNLVQLSPSYQQSEIECDRIIESLEIAIKAQSEALPTLSVPAVSKETTRLAHGGVRFEPSCNVPQTLLKMRLNITALLESIDGLWCDTEDLSSSSTPSPR